MKIEFDRIGRNHNVGTIEVADSDDPDQIAHDVWMLARKHLISRDIDVTVNLETDIVQIYVGFHPGGTGHIIREETSDDQDQHQ